MSEVSANVAIAGEPTGLGAQVLADESAALEQAIPKIEGKQEVPEPSKPNDEKLDGNGEVEEPKETEPKEGDQPKEGEGKKPEEPKNATVKIGKQEFATVQDAMREATRIMGHNAALSGALTKAEARANEATTALESIKTQLDEAVKVNQQWAEWHEKTTAGDPASPPRATQPPVEDIVRKVMTEQDQAKAESMRMETMKAEFDKVQSAPNYPQVAETIYRIADQINPLTGKYFTPKEAYEYACRMTGIAPEFETPAPQPHAPATPPKPPVNPAVKSSAARPSGSGRAPATPSKSDATMEDEALARAFPL